METYGDLKKTIKAISRKQKGEKIGKVAIDTVIRYWRVQVSREEIDYIINI